MGNAEKFVEPSINVSIFCAPVLLTFGSGKFSQKIRTESKATSAGTGVRWGGTGPPEFCVDFVSLSGTNSKY
jgi:hypothetical protein